MESAGDGGIQAVIRVPDNVKRVDVVSTHRHEENGIVLNVSSPYSRWEP